MCISADLHTHSTASDGQYTPPELVTLAQKSELNTLAITDHDTLDGLEEAEGAAVSCGLHLIRGVELGAKEYKDLHILGYGFSQEAPELRALCKQMKDSRDERKYRIIAFLKEKGVHISLDEVEEMAGGDIIARPHFARVMVKRGYVSTTWEAFDRYLDTGEYQKIERFKADARTCIEAIRAGGGKVSLAHPYQLKLDNDALDSLVCQLAGYGLDAMECHYPRHTPEQTEFYLGLTRKYNLHISGGSDFHGEAVKPDVVLSKLALDLSWLDERKG